MYEIIAKKHLHNRIISKNYRKSEKKEKKSLKRISEYEVIDFLSWQPKKSDQCHYNMVGMSDQLCNSFLLRWKFKSW